MAHMSEEFEKRYLHWIDQAVKESEKKDDFKSLPGFGRPLSKEALEGGCAFVNSKKRPLSAGVAEAAKGN